MAINSSNSNTGGGLEGVIAAIATAIDATGEPDCARSTALARFLLAHGCDGLNVLGTTGGLPMHRLMVGTGAAALADAIALTRHAADLGFAAALLLPPFYYKGVPDEGLIAYVDRVLTATAAKPIPIYLYHFPVQSGLPWHAGLIKRLLDTFGHCIAGLKDSSGDMACARAAATIAPGFKVFPSTEAILPEARAGLFAGCISATANLNADLCAQGWHTGDATALETAVAIRKLFDGKPLVPGVKALLAHIHRDPAWARVQAPLDPYSPAERDGLANLYDGLRARACSPAMAASLARAL